MILLHHYYIFSCNSCDKKVKFLSILIYLENALLTRRLNVLGPNSMATLVQEDN